MTVETDPNVLLDELLPDEFVTAKLRQILREIPDGIIELDAGAIPVDSDCKLEIVSKAFVSRRLDLGFGSCFTALFAVGGVESLEHGILEAVHCFSVLWISPNHELITVDFSSVCPS